MRLLPKALLVAWLIVALAYLPAARAQTSVPDTEQSARLADYLHAHRLPLVGAQVLNSGSGRSVLLYGYTASDFGKGDAEAKTRRFLGDSALVINNHIRVRPELASMRTPRSYSPSASSASSPPPSADTGAPAPPPDAEAPPPDVAAYQNQQQQNAQQQYVNQQAQQYMNQGNTASSLTSALIPLLGMGLAIGLGGGGSGFGMGVSPGFGSFGGSPFGGSQYGNPYGGGPYGYPSGPSPYGGPSNPYP
ncbi:MAG TPA: hypothetical protein VGH29_05210 [Candidatus Binataceae bacterium]